MPWYVAPTVAFAAGVAEMLPKSHAPRDAFSDPSTYRWITSSSSSHVSATWAQVPSENQFVGSTVTLSEPTANWNCVGLR